MSTISLQETNTIGLYWPKYFPPAEQVAVPVPMAIFQHVEQYAQQGNWISLEEAVHALLDQALKAPPAH